MIPSDELVQKFQEAVKTDYGDDISFEDARKVLTGLTSYFDLLAKIYHRMKTEDKEEKENIEKIKQAKTGEPIELTGYIVYDREGNDTGKRFVRREDAEAYQREMYGE